MSNIVNDCKYLAGLLEVSFPLVPENASTICRNAAAEIERLRAELADLHQQLADRIAEIVQIREENGHLMARLRELIGSESDPD